jgi:hypothetical protein
MIKNINLIETQGVPDDLDQIPWQQDSHMQTPVGRAQLVARKTINGCC